MVRDSAIDGRGVFAVAPLARGDLAMTVVGPMLDWDDAQRRVLGGELGDNVVFALGDGSVLDASAGDARGAWLNHGCDPNCVAVAGYEVVTVAAARSNEVGEELLIDYALTVARAPTRWLRYAARQRSGRPAVSGCR